MKQSKSALCVLLAGTLWGSMGLFVRKLNAVGLYALDIVQLRIAISLVLVGLYLLIFARDKLRVRLRDLWCFAGTGIVSLLLFSWCYFSGMQEASLSVMAVLLYTSPAFIVLLSVLLFRETLTRQKLLALVLTFAGCCLVSGLGSGSAVSMKGLLLGLGSGFFYALYSIFSRYAIVDHHVLHLPVLPARQRPACALGSDCAGTVKRCLRSGVRASDGTAYGLSGVYLLYEGA